MGNYNSPNNPVWDPGKSSLQLREEALELEERHNQWHEDHPGEPCPPEFFNANSYDDIARGDKLLGAMTFEAGDALPGKKG